MLSQEQQVLISTTIAEANMMGEYDYSTILRLVMAELKANGEPFEADEAKLFMRKKFLKTYALRGPKND